MRLCDYIVWFNQLIANHDLLGDLLNNAALRGLFNLRLLARVSIKFNLVSKPPLCGGIAWFLQTGALVRQRAQFFLRNYSVVIFGVYLYQWLVQPPKSLLPIPEFRTRWVRLTPKARPCPPTSRSN